MTRGILRHIGLSLRLNARNRMAMIYGYLFPLIFLVAFWAIYRHDKVPLVLHMGELLTVTALGGACFGLPTTMVSERERGVWRRYRLLPAPTWAFVTSTVVARYVLLITAALLQIALAMAIGMPAPSDPLGLLVAFTFASAAFIGLGLVIAMLANNVPAVQALGQCIFLPMLMIGGVAVRLSSLPDWALHASAFFPGRYAVKALQDSITGNGLSGVYFELLALLLIGLAGGVAAAKMFRWDARQRLSTKGGKTWIAVALGVWILVGVAAEFQGRVAVGDTAVDTADVGSAEDYLAPVAPRPAVATRPPTEVPVLPVPVTPSTPVAEPPPPPPSAPASWRTVTSQDIAGVAFERLPPDSGVVSPIATEDEEIDPIVAAQLEDIGKALADWPPGKVADPVQRARNYLYVAAVPDVLQMEQVERALPLLVFQRLQEDIPQKDLPGILYWIAMHPEEGDDSAIGQLELLGLPGVTGPTKPARGRVMLYAFKLLGRLTGDIAPK